MTPRRDGTTLQQRVFHALLAGEQSAAQLAAATGELRDSCRKACQYMRERGVVEIHRKGRWTTYSAVAGKKPPRDMRGKRAASRNHRGAHAWAKWLLMMKAKHGPTWRPPVRGCALAEAWSNP